MQDHKAKIAGNPHILQIIARQLFNFFWHRGLKRRNIAPLELRVPSYNSLARGRKLVPMHIVCGNITRHCLGSLGLHQYIIAAHRHGQLEAGGSGQLF
jgi:hypothetical protein